MTSILSIHNTLLDHLNLIRHTTPNLYFATRERDAKGRLSEGYWFIGNEHYLQTTFWTGRDWNERIYNIGFCVLSDGRSYIELSAQDNPETAQVLAAIAEQLGGFVQMGAKAKWQRYYKGNDYLANLIGFITEAKPAIEEVLLRWPVKIITAIDQLQFQDRFMKVVLARSQQLAPRLPAKLARVCYNTHGWRYPSRSEGKSESPNSFEHIHGFGHEEWLFDFSKTINGYKYGFVEPLRVESGVHFGKEYDLTLFTRTKDGRLLAVAAIRDIYCIDNIESLRIHAVYREKGWLSEMEQDVATEGGKWKSFISDNPSTIFNFCFQPEDVQMLGLREINPNDPNIRGHRINLRDFRSPLIYVQDLADADQDSGYRSTAPRIRTNDGGSTIYDPVHEIMLQKLEKHLHRQERYKLLKYEDEYVDLKGLTFDNNWHYFEIKTACPRLCVRQALGQIMEYAYYELGKKVTKLFIVGPEQADEKTVAYLRQIRASFAIPVYYRSFDKEGLILSEPC